MVKVIAVGWSSLSASFSGVLSSIHETDKNAHVHITATHSVSVGLLMKKNKTKERHLTETKDMWK